MNNTHILIYHSTFSVAVISVIGQLWTSVSSCSFVLLCSSRSLVLFSVGNIVHSLKHGFPEGSTEILTEISETSCPLFLRSHFFVWVVTFKGAFYPHLQNKNSTFDQTEFKLLRALRSYDVIRVPQLSWWCNSSEQGRMHSTSCRVLIKYATFSANIYWFWIIIEESLQLINLFLIHLIYYQLSSLINSCHTV